MKTTADKRMDDHSDSGKMPCSSSKAWPLVETFPAIGRSEHLLKAEFLVLSSAVVVFGVSFLVSGGIGTPVSRGLLLGLVVALFVFHLRYMTRVEGRTLAGLFPYSLLLWASAGGSEALGLWFGAYRYEAMFLTAPKLGPVPLLIPSMWLLFCWMASSITYFLWGPPPSPKARFSFLPRALMSAWILISIAFAIEWHFSLSAGIWSWIDAPGRWRIDGVPIINFMVWFNIGLVAPIIEHAARAPRIAYRTESLALRALPTLGLILVLFVNSALNFSRGFPGGGVLSGSSFLILAAAAGRRYKNMRRRN
jgi:hypothetical protein